MKNQVHRFVGRTSASLLRVLLTLAILVLALPKGAMADRSITVVVAPEDTSAIVSTVGAGLIRGGSFVGVSDPTHGIVSFDENQLNYQPSQSFWSVGVDSVTVVTNEETFNPVLRVHFVAGRREGNNLADDFESLGPSGTEGQHDVMHDPDNILDISPDGAITGNLGLMVELEVTDTEPAYLSYGHLGTLAARLHHGTAGTPGDQDGGAEIRLDTDPNNGGGGGSGPPFGLLEGINWDYGGVTTFQLQAQIVNGRVQMQAVQADTAGVMTATGWQEVGFGVQTVRLEWWTAAHAAATGGLRMWINHTVVGELSGIVNFDRYTQEVRLGAPAVPLAPIGGYRIDDFQLTTGDVVPDVSILFEDGFEGPSHPLTSGSGMEPSVGAITGTGGLVLGRGQVLTDSSPNGEDNFSIRFAVDLSGVTSERTEIDLLNAYESDQLDADLVAGLRLTAQDKETWMLSGVADNDASQRLQTSGVPISSNDPHVIELQWWKSHSPIFAGGRLRILVDGVVVGGLTNISAFFQSVETYELGFGAQQRSAFGTMLIDDVITWVDQ